MNSTQAHLTPLPAAITLIRQHEARMARSIQLYAGACILSPRVHEALSNSMGLMPAMGEAYRKQQPGTQEVSALEELVSGQVNALFGGAWAEARLQSCTYANAAVYAAFSRPNDLVAAIAAQDGGHVSHHESGTLGVLDRRHLPLVFTDGVYDDAASAQQIRRHRPRIVMLGASVMLDPYTVDATIHAAHECGALLVYDASHVAGLIAGGLYQNPMDMGFDLMTMSTYKTLSAPPGGLLLGKDPEHYERLKRHLVGGWTSNYDAGRLAGLSVALEEAQHFMRDYMRQAVADAAYLHQALQDRGVPVLNSGRPEAVAQSSHQLVIQTDTPADARALLERAEAVGILAGTSSAPGRPGRGGLRLGLHVATRRGIRHDALDTLADCLSRLYADPAPATDLVDTVRRIVDGLDCCLYCFD